MYKFEGDKISKRNTKKEIKVDQSVLLLIIKYINKYKSSDKAFRYLKANKFIDTNIADSTYKRKLSRLPEYKAMMNARSLKSNERYDRVINLKKQGFSHSKIALKVGLTYDVVYGILKRNNTTCEPKERTMSLAAARTKVDNWYKDFFNGKIPTTETLQAFKLLGLEPPKVNY